MADRTSIEWAHATVNAISGCSVVSPGCTNCYAMRAGAHNRPHHPSRGLTQAGGNGQHVWTGAVRLNEEWLKRPLNWAKPRRIFWNAHGDPFHPAVPQEWVDRELAIAALSLQHRHLFLTKRSDRMRRYFERSDVAERILGWCRHLGFLPDAARWSWPLPNVWLGISVEDQKRADQRREDFRNTPAAVKFVSYEPALGYVNWAGWRFVDQIIAGGESGPQARPPHPRWFRDTRDWCAANDVRFLFKQWGEWHPSDQHHDCSMQEIMAFRQDSSQEWRPSEASGWAFKGGWQGMCRIGKGRAGRLLDGKLHDAYPELFKWELEQRKKTPAAREISA